MIAHIEGVQSRFASLQHLSGTSSDRIINTFFQKDKAKPGLQTQNISRKK
jgi:hypothetical protein